MNRTEPRVTRIWRIVLLDEALDLVAGLSPRLGQLRGGIWVPNHAEIARQGGVSKQALADVGSRYALGEAVQSALLGVAATHGGMTAEQAWPRLFKLVREADVCTETERTRAA